MHFVTTMFSVLAGCTSLRKACMWLEAYEGKPNHINIKKVPPGSTLSAANKRCASPVFQEIFNYLNSKDKGAIPYCTLPNEVLFRLFFLMLIVTVNFTIYFIIIFCFFCKYFFFKRKQYILTTKPLLCCAYQNLSSFSKRSLNFFVPKQYFPQSKPF